MKKLLVLFPLLLLSLSVNAEWMLQNEKSSVNIVSIKKSKIGEVHSFNRLAGSISDAVAEVKVDLSSINTNIPIRDDRMKSMLFEVSKYSEARINANISQELISKLKVGNSLQKTTVISVSLHGVTKDVEVVVQIVKLTGESLLVSSISPIIINASDFNLSKGVEALRKVAHLPVISTAVPVTFNLVFQQ